MADSETEPSILLRGVPLDLFQAFDEQTAALLREYALVCIADAQQPYTVADVALAQSAKTGLTEWVGAAARDSSGGPLDVPVALSDADVASLGVFQGILEEANRLAREGRLLLLPSLPEIVALRNWLVSETTAQAAGAEPSPWPPGFVAREEPALPPATWEGMSALPSDQMWIVGDDTNLIIGASTAALELLGWQDGGLVGQRIVAIIPPEHRQAHVAAFTRGLVTGEHRLLNQPLALSAHHREGRDIPVTLELSEQPATGGRTVFIGHLIPR